MIKIHDGTHRGQTRTGWLDSQHTFSFGGFQDPTRMGFGALRVINEDRIIPGTGFSEHPHQEMDILTLVLTGGLNHRDTMGNVSTIVPGQAQLMSAGTGIRHSEMNASDSEPAHFLQIWLIPESHGGQPTYQQAALPKAASARDWSLFASGDNAAGALKLLSNTNISIANAREGGTLTVPDRPDRLTFIHIISGLAFVGGERLGAGTGLENAGEDLPPIKWITDGQALLFDMKR